jgi:hypothetical protein
MSKEQQFLNDLHRGYEIRRIETVIETLDAGVFKSLSSYADAEHFLRFALTEIRRLKKENADVEQRVQRHEKALNEIIAYSTDENAVDVASVSMGYVEGEQP